MLRMVTLAKVNMVKDNMAAKVVMAVKVVMVVKANIAVKANVAVNNLKKEKLLTLNAFKWMMRNLIML